jgi:hypothetical protein
MQKKDQLKQAELMEVIREMNGLIDEGTLRESSDFHFWFEEIKLECHYCKNEIDFIVKTYLDNL